MRCNLHCIAGKHRPCTPPDARPHTSVLIGPRPKYTRRESRQHSVLQTFVCNSFRVHSGRKTKTNKSVIALAPNLRHSVLRVFCCGVGGPGRRVRGTCWSGAQVRQAPFVPGTNLGLTCTHVVTRDRPHRQWFLTPLIQVPAQVHDLQIRRNEVCIKPYDIYMWKCMYLWTRAASSLYIYYNDV